VLLEEALVVRDAVLTEHEPTKKESPIKSARYVSIERKEGAIPAVSPIEWYDGTPTIEVDCGT
jgi:hypothetical protein